ncbi:very short patch repair endonuclease [Qipengyuania spongiae]|uniref:Very short patch repair endonuclease n=1 Tax=Qipengyuania spongiae TaxID=2909673 RepID=A0ABY5SZR3_9SPHN|nr:DNA mismatch endonuclease Vsr [Qipengyuania spongiae]UVI39680.1 DNA mismatch endonuclease Vsr [Qipengyuania spongiae]
MADSLTPERRSWNMSRIRSRDTRPERALRSMLHRAGFRFRLHDRSLPGTPDIVMRKYRAAILVHGCYWHRHEGCRNATTPSTRTDFWLKKFGATVERDKRNLEALTVLGWKPIVVWECDLKRRPDDVMAEIKQELGVV